MIDRVKELRIKIDGLAQLVEHLHPQRFFKIDISQIPENWTVENFIEVFQKKGYAITDSYKRHSRETALTSAIQEVPQQFKEIEKAKDSLYLAKAWLGKMLQELGEQTPYQNDGKRKDVKDIEDTSDKANHNDVVSVHYHLLYPEMNYIEKVDFIREEIKKAVEETTKRFGRIQCLDLSLSELRGVFPDHGLKDMNYNLWNSINQCYNHLTEARFWLGFELQRIKEQDDTRKESSNN